MVGTNMKKILHRPYRLSVKIAKKNTDLDKIIKENENLKSENKEIQEKLKSFEAAQNFGWPNGHFHSPVHTIDDLKSYNKVVDRSKNTFEESMPSFSPNKIVNEFNKIKSYFIDFNYPKDDDGVSRFYSNNGSLSLFDSLVIFSMLRKHKPKRIIEIGSGFSSGLMMEVNEKYFDNKINITLIEPYPQLLYSRMKKGDKTRYKVIPNGVQNVPLDVFRQLKKDDILFIDSTHVSKFNSDVNYEIFDILPKLAKGVIIHIHDIHDGFEYPLNWLKIGWAWNEAYLLRAFLMNNNEYEIMLINDYLIKNHSDLLAKKYTKDDKIILSDGSDWIKHSGSFWMRKI